MKIFMSGATGFVGRHLILRLLRDGHEITIWARNPSKAALTLGGEVKVIGGADKFQLHEDALDGFDAVINLAGAPIAGGRWTRKRKQLIRDSRVHTTEALVKACQTVKAPPAVFISASAIGYYGPGLSDAVFHEQTPAGNGFLADVCQAWEKPLEELPASTRCTVARIGLVLGLQEGLLDKLTPVFDAGLGGVMGTGKQMMSWIHISDLVEIFVSALDSEKLNGPVNCVAPNPVSHKVFCKTLAQTIRRPCIFWRSFNRTANGAGSIL